VSIGDLRRLCARRILQSNLIYKTTEYFGATRRNPSPANAASGAIEGDGHMAKKGEPTTNLNAESVSTPPPEVEYTVLAEDHEAVARLAYSFWEARGCPIGSPEEDWYRAENELRRPLAAAAA
jgi:Protein of unknown function (DUF2934)